MPAQWETRSGVGGLIIGQAAVSANLVSPMVVVVVALTALGDFAIPSEELSEGIRTVKYAYFFSVQAWDYGFFLGLVFLLVHLANREKLRRFLPNSPIPPGSSAERTGKTVCSAFH